MAVTLAETLRASREAMGLTLRAIEQRSAGKIKNAYLSQVETGQILRPSPQTLWLLSDIYGLEYDALLISAGHRLADGEPQRIQASAGIPLRALDDLSADQRRQVTNFIGFLRQQTAAGERPIRAGRRRSAAGHRWDSE